MQSNGFLKVDPLAEAFITSFLAPICGFVHKAEMPSRKVTIFFEKNGFNRMDVAASRLDESLNVWRMEKETGNGDDVHCRCNYF